MKIVKSSLHNHLRTSSYITERDVKKSVKTAAKRLRKGGVLGVINFNPSENETDPRWDLFVRKLRYDCIKTGNGIYLPQAELDLLIVRGQEVPTAEGYHVLLIGTTPEQNVRNGSSLEEVLELKDKFGAIAIADHPFHKHGMGYKLKINPELYSRFEGYEVFNGICELGSGEFKYANKKAQDEYNTIKEKYPDLAEIVSDDGHSVYETGRSYSNIKMPSDYEVFRDFPERVVGALKDGYKANREERLGDKRQGSIMGALNHAADLAVLIAAGKFLGWHPNNKTAPLLESMGIRV